MEDRNFWLNLEFDMCGLLARSQDFNNRGYWIDGLIPQSIENSKTGVEVSGDIWVGEGPKCQTKCRFLARIPQKLLNNQARDFDYEIIAFDIANEYVEFNIDVPKVPPPD